MSYANWSPALLSRRVYDRRPPVGSLIAVDRKPWRVVAVDEIHAADWSARARDMWLIAGMPDAWQMRPFHVNVKPSAGGEIHGGTIEPWNCPTWDVIPEHYAVCVSCGELAPCLAHTAKLRAEREMVRVEKEMSLLPGCCPACQEPITSRQETVTFAGDNLLLPIGDPDVTFHMRSKCRSSAARYEEMWVRADLTRPRSLLTLSCEGSVIVHHDGSSECFGAAGSDCPSVYARHRRYAACYAQSNGCGRGCSPTGHPGTRQARPKVARR